ncbi:hypothetical protein ACTXT7_008235 [Hymenolepis weldensis]
MNLMLEVKGRQKFLKDTCKDATAKDHRYMGLNILAEQFLAACIDLIIPFRNTRLKAMYPLK